MDLLQRGIGAVVGATLLELAGLPAGALLGAALGASLVAVRQRVRTTLPAPARLGAFVVLGWLLGSRVDADALAAVPGLAGPVGVTLVALLAGAVATAVALTRLAGWRPTTATLAAAPGGLTEMVAMGTISGEQAELVAAAHLLRLVTILVVVPPLALLLE